MARERELDPDLDARQVALISALLVCASIVDAAKKADVPAPTAYRWMKDPAFAQAYQRARDEALNGAIAVLKGGAASAAVTLRQLAEDTSVPASVRVSASGKLLDLAMKSHETDELGRRVAELEAALDQMRGLLTRQVGPVN